MNIPNKYSLLVAAIVLVNIAVASILLPIRNAAAAPLTTTYLRLARMGTGTSGPARLVFKTGSAGATSISINMNGTDSTTWTGQSGAVAAAPVASSASCAAETSATALPGTLSASGSGSTITISGITALGSGQTYCVDLTAASAITNPNAAGEYHPVITAGSDSVTIATRVVSNDSVAVSAVVPPTFSFALSSNSDTFTTSLSSGAVTSTNGVQVTVNTNAKTGWLAWIRDSSSGLNSAATVKTINSVATGSTTNLTTGSEGYGVGVTNLTPGSGAGTMTADAAYNATASSGVNNTVGGVDGTLRQLASSTGTASGAIFTVKARATISTITPAASDYTDTLTIIGAARF